MSGDQRTPCKFDERLLHCIRYHENAEATSFLHQNLVKARDDFGTLLHYAATIGNAAMAEHLINQGWEVDCPGRRGKTPLMLAVSANNRSTVAVLLSANASVNVVDDQGRSALQMSFDRRQVSVDIFLSLFDKLRADAAVSIDEAAEKLVTGGCTLHRAAYLEDIEVLECMLNRGIDVDSADDDGSTALHAAADLNNLRLVECLVARGADVNALEKSGYSPLHYAVRHANKALMELLVERGADPNAKSIACGITPLYLAVRGFGSFNGSDETDECVEILLRPGGVPQNPEDGPTIVDHALANGVSVRSRSLTAQLALIEKKTGDAVAKNAMTCSDRDCQPDLAKLKIYYEQCLLVLESKMFENSSLLDLLTAGEAKMRRLARNETFASQIEVKRREIGQEYSYYCKTLMKRVDEAVASVELEDRVISIFCDVFAANENECYVPARMIVGYLDKRELEHLCEAFSEMSNE